jgi:predicted lipoprotein with Yx(FWY)xxD motif
MKSIHAAGAVFVSLLAAAAVAAAPGGLMKKDGVLVDTKGMTVYTFDQDAANSGKSACVDGCLTNWPAVMAPAGDLAAPYSAITRPDGTRQLAYKGKPLYTFVKDKKTGDKAGDNVKNMWHAVTD